MFTYSQSLVICLSLLGLQGSIPTQNPNIQVQIDEYLFLDPEMARLHFMTITFYLFCCLDFQRAFSSLKPYWPTESPLEEKKYILNALAWLEELVQSECPLSYVPLKPVFFSHCTGPVMQKIIFCLSLTVIQKLIDNNFKTDLPAAQYVDQTRLKVTAEQLTEEFLEMEDNALLYNNTDERYLYFEKTIIQHLKTYPLRESYTRAVKSYLEQGCHHYNKPVQPPQSPPQSPLQSPPQSQSSLPHASSRKTSLTQPTQPPTDTKQTATVIDLQLEQQAQSYAQRLQYRTIFNSAYFDSMEDKTVIVIKEEEEEPEEPEEPEPEEEEDSTAETKDTRSTTSSISFKQKIQQEARHLHRKPSESGFHFTKPKEEVNTTKPKYDFNNMKSPFLDSHSPIPALFKHLYEEEDDDERNVEVGRSDRMISPPLKRDIRAALNGIKKDKGKGIEVGFRNPIYPPPPPLTRYTPEDPLSQITSRIKRKQDSIDPPERHAKRLHTRASSRIIK